MFRRVSFADPVSCIQKTARFVMPIMSKSCGDLQASAGLRGQYDDHLRGFRGKGIASHWNWWSLTAGNLKTPPLAHRNGRSIVPNRSAPEATVARESNSRKPEDTAACASRRAIGDNGSTLKAKVENSGPFLHNLNVFLATNSVLCSL